MDSPLGVGPLWFPIANALSIISFHLSCMLGGSVRIKWRAPYFGALKAKLILAPLGMPNEFDSQWINFRMFYVQTSTLPPGMHCKLTKHGSCCMQNNQLPTKYMLWYRITLKVEPTSVCSLVSSGCSPCTCCKIFDGRSQTIHVCVRIQVHRHVMQGTKFHLPCTKLIRHHFGRIVNVFPDLACRLFPEFSNCEDCETATTDSSEEANSRNKDYIHPFHRTIAVRRGLLAEESADMMQSFFQMRRLQTKGAQQTSTPLDKVVPWTRALRWFPSVLKRLNVPNRWFHFWCSIHGFCQVFCSLLAPPVSNSYASPSALHVVDNVWPFLEQRLCVFTRAITVQPSQSV